MKSCLIVEDSTVVRQIAARIVDELGFCPREAANASEAIEMCRGEKADVVLLDWDLPAMGALDFLRGVGVLDPDARPVIVLCATENDHQQFALAKAAGAAHHILKPYDKDAIEAKFAEIGLVERSATNIGRAAS